MSTVHLHLTVQHMPEARKWTATIRREDRGAAYGLTRPFDARRDAERWLVENVKAELADTHGEGGEAA